MGGEFLELEMVSVRCLSADQWGQRKEKLDRHLRNDPSRNSSSLDHTQNSLIFFRRASFGAVSYTWPTWMIWHRWTGLCLCGPLETLLHRGFVYTDKRRVTNLMWQTRGEGERKRKREKAHRNATSLEFLSQKLAGVPYRFHVWHERDIQNNRHLKFDQL